MQPSTDSPSAVRPWRFTLRGLFIGVTIAALGCATIHYLVRIVSIARQSVRQSETANDFKWVLLSLRNFHDTYRVLPDAIHRDTGETPRAPLPRRNEPNSKPLYSWRFSVINFVASYKIAPAWNKPWDDPVHAVWNTCWTPYCDDPERATSSRRDTKIFAITGPGTAWDDANPLPTSLRDFDWDTILIAEVRNSGTHWMQPGDFDIRTMPRTINAPDGKGISGEYPDGFHIGLADGSVRFLPSNIPFEVLEKFFTVEGAKQYDLDEELAPYLAH